MDLAWISVGALVVAVTLSMVTTINVGIVCLAFAWIVGVLLAGMSVGDLLDGFPTGLFITLAGVTLFFGMARGNGTLERITERAVRLCRGHTGILPIMFFFLALGLSTIGPGSIGATTSSSLSGYEMRDIVVETPSRCVWLAARTGSADEALVSTALGESAARARDAIARYRAAAAKGLVPAIESGENEGRPYFITPLPLAAPPRGRAAGLMAAGDGGPEPASRRASARSPEYGRVFA